MAGFKWSEKATKAAFALADGKTREIAAKEAAVSERTLYNWLDDPEFSAEVDRLTLMTGIAGRAERVRIAKRVVQQRVRHADGFMFSDKDLLDWLKFAQSETDGVKLDLTALLEAAESVAVSGQGGADTLPGAQELR